MIDTKQYDRIGGSGKRIERTGFTKLLFQINLLLWKRYRETTKNRGEIFRVVFPPLLVFALLLLIYSLLSIFHGGAIEPYFVPVGFWVFMQRIVVQIMYEKSSRLQESMRMMGLSDIAYWVSYFISEGIILGFSISILCTIMSAGGLFNNGNFGEVLGMLLVFCLSAVPFSFFITAFFDTPQSAGQATLAILMGRFDHF